MCTCGLLKSGPFWGISVQHVCPWVYIRPDRLSPGGLKSRAFPMDYTTPYFAYMAFLCGIRQLSN